MCTLTAIGTEDGGYRLVFNRDERRSRPEAEPPKRAAAGAARVPCLAPRDPEGGGTWIAANAYGLSIALLNLYQDAARFRLPEGEEPISRGLVVRRLASQASLADVSRALGDQAASGRLARVRPFQLIAVAPGTGSASPASALEVRWSGRALVASPRTLPTLAVSSSLRFDESVVARRSVLVPALEALVDRTTGLAHASPPHGKPGAADEALDQALLEAMGLHGTSGHEGPIDASDGELLGPCVHRPLAVTHSTTLVHVRPGSGERLGAARMRYRAGSPCRGGAMLDSCISVRPVPSSPDEARALAERRAPTAAPPDRAPSPGAPHRPAARPPRAAGASPSHPASPLGGRAAPEVSS